jgi:hypothetical protein
MACKASEWIGAVSLDEESKISQILQEQSVNLRVRAKEIGS